MNGYDVLFPQGWDCHGLPTEVKVEEIHNIRKNDVLGMNSVECA